MIDAKRLFDAGPEDLLCCAQRCFQAAHSQGAGLSDCERQALWVASQTLRRCACLGTEEHFLLIRLQDAACAERLEFWIQRAWQVLSQDQPASVVGFRAHAG